MRRNMYVFLIVVGILVLGVRVFVDQGRPSENPPGTEIQFIRYDALTPPNAAESPLAQLQRHVDRVSEAAMKGQWTTASRAVQQLEDVWMGLSPRQAANLETEREMERAIQTLYYNVWGKDQQGVLSTAGQLTALIRQLAG